MVSQEAIEFCKDEINWIKEEIYNYPRNREYAVVQFNKIITLLKTKQEWLLNFQVRARNNRKI